jgi:hypothetical protein
MKRKHPLYQHDPAAWHALSLAERLAYLRKEYCFGPCGAAHDPRKEELDRALREAVAELEKLQALARRAHQLEAWRAVAVPGSEASARICADTIALSIDLAELAKEAPHA